MVIPGCHAKVPLPSTGPSILNTEYLKSADDLETVFFFERRFRYRWCLLPKISNNELFSSVQNVGYDRWLGFHRQRIPVAWMLTTGARKLHDLNSMHIEVN
jgi:hypothetical protein